MGDLLPDRSAQGHPGARGDREAVAQPRKGGVQRFLVADQGPQDRVVAVDGALGHSSME